MDFQWVWEIIFLVLKDRDFVYENLGWTYITVALFVHKSWSKTQHTLTETRTTKISKHKKYEKGNNQKLYRKFENLVLQFNYE